MLKAEGFDDAIIGTCYDYAAAAFRLIYSLEKCVILIVKKENISEESAIEWLEYNVITMFIGPGQPIFLENYKDNNGTDD